MESAGRLRVANTGLEATREKLEAELEETKGRLMAALSKPVTEGAGGKTWKASVVTRSAVHAAFLLFGPISNDAELWCSGRVIRSRDLVSSWCNVCCGGFIRRLQNVREQDEGAGEGAVPEDLQSVGTQATAEGDEPARGESSD